MDIDHLRHEALAELDRRPVDVDAARRSVDARVRRHRQKVSIGVIAAAGIVIMLAAGLALTQDDDAPSSLDVVSAGEDPTTSTTAVAGPGSGLFFLVPSQLPPGVALVDVLPPGDSFASSSVGANTSTQYWARFRAGGDVEARFDVTVADGSLAEHPGESTTVGAFPAIYDPFANAIVFEDAPGHVVTVSSTDLTRQQLDAIAASWQPGIDASFTVDGPPDFELVATENAFHSTGPSVRAALYGDGDARGFTIQIDEPVNERFGAERLYGGRATTIRGHDGIIAPMASSFLGVSYAIDFYYLMEADLVLRWHEGGSSIALLGVGLSEAELRSLAEGMQVAPIPADPFQPAELSTYCGAVATIGYSEGLLAPDGHPTESSSTTFEFMRTVAPDEAIASIDVMLEWFQAGSPRPVPAPVTDAETTLTQQWTETCTDYPVALPASAGG